MLLSIIIPIYNIEKYLGKCVESLTSLSLKDTEILLVDDGSTDSSKDIADKLSIGSSCIKVFHKKNGGLSSARNYGIAKSSGKYLLFIDGDDYVDEHLLELYDYLKGDYDAIFVGMNVEYLKKTKIISFKFKEYIGKDNSKDLVHMTTRENSACLKIVKKDFISKHNLYFEDGFAEDFNWTGKLFQYLNNCITTPIIYYHYVAERENSIMNVCKKQRFYEIINHSKSIIKEFDKSKISDDFKIKIRQYIGFNILRNFARAKYLDKQSKKEIYVLLKDNKDLIRYQGLFLAKMFYLVVKVFGSSIAFKLIKSG